MSNTESAAEALAQHVPLRFDNQIDNPVCEPIYIDKEKENKEVKRFQMTGDIQILERVYEKRIPTLWKWTSNHYIPGLTCCSREDLFAEFTLVFVKAAHEYQIKRGTFNTCLFTFLLNRIKNIKSSRYAKKRRAKDYDGPLSGMVLSLDYSYSNKEGSDVSLKDIIPDEKEIAKHPATNLLLEETLDMLSQKNHDIKEFFRKLSDGNSLTTLIKEYRIRTGSLKLTRPQVKLLSGKRRCVNIVSNLIKKKGGVKESFSIVDYEVKRTLLHYRIEMEKTNEVDFILKTIRKLRNNRHEYLGIGQESKKIRNGF